MPLVILLFVKCSIAYVTYKACLDYISTRLMLSASRFICFSISFFLNSVSFFIYYFTKQISNIARGQRQILHQLENVTNNLHNLGEVLQQTESVQKGILVDFEHIRVSVILTLAIGGVGIFLFRGYVSRSWSTPYKFVDIHIFTSTTSSVSHK